MRTLAILLTGVSFLLLSACTLPLVGEDNFLRGKQSSWNPKEDPEYRAVDNAIYDELVSRFGKDEVFLSEYPEEEYHRWMWESPHRNAGARMNTTVEARPMMDDHGRWIPSIQVKDNVYVRGDPFRKSTSAEFGTSPYIEGARSDKRESILYNAVMKRIQDWRAKGHPEPGNRRAEYIAAHGS